MTMDNLVGLLLYHLVFVIQFSIISQTNTSTFPKKDCEHEIAGVNKTIYVPSNTTTGSRIHVIGWPSKRRRKRQSPTDDIFLATNSSYFELIESRGNPDEWDIVTKACLYEGLVEILAFSVSEILDPYKYCKLRELKIVISPTKPVIKDNDEIEVDVEGCISKNILEVHTITFLNQGDCALFVCSVKCINRNKDFWIGPGYVIVTAVDAIDFMVVYELEVTCADRQLYWKRDLSQQTSIDLTFTNKNACTQSWTLPTSVGIASTSTPSTTNVLTSSATLPPPDTVTTTPLSIISAKVALPTTMRSFLSSTDILSTKLPSRSHIQSKTETNVDFFDEKLHVIAVSIFCGSLLLVLLFICLCALCCRRCFFVSVAPANTDNDDKHEESHSRPVNQV